MTRNLCFFVLIPLILAACQPDEVAPVIPQTPEPTQELVNNTATLLVLATLPVTTTSLPSVTPATTIKPTSTPTTAPTSSIQPVIHEQPGDLYETVFSIPAGDNKTFHYLWTPTWIAGPNAMAILPDDSILIADAAGNRLHYFSPVGRLLKTILLGKLGIEFVMDLRAKGNEIFLLETSHKRYAVHHMALDGTLIASDEIPYRFPIDANDKDLRLENALTGIAIDCEVNIILEVASGSMLLRLSDVQQRANPDDVTQGYFCSGKRYQVISTKAFQIPKVSAGNTIYETRLTHGLGSLTFLDVLPNGGFYLVRSDVIDDPNFRVDTTVNFIGPDGAVKGTARVPNSEFYIHPMRQLAINSNGEVFVLLPRLHSVDVLRLNFYKQMEPLIPGAAIPQITVVQDNP